MNQGRYIVIEGPAGVGKTTQVQLLAQKLQEAGYPVRIFAQPPNLSDLALQAIKNPQNSNDAQNFYTACAQYLEPIHAAVQSGTICLSSHGLLDLLVTHYYGWGNTTDYNFLRGLLDTAAILQPNVTIVLDASAQSLHNKATPNDPKDEAYYERIRAGYLWEARQRGLPVVFADNVPEKVSEAIWQLLGGKVRSGQPQPATEPVHVGTETPATPIAEVLAEKKRSLKKPRYAVPEGMRGSLRREYITTMNTLFSSIAEMTTKLATHLDTHDQQTVKKTTKPSPAALQKARKYLLPLLPVASLENFSPRNASAAFEAMDAIAERNLPGRLGSLDDDITLSERWPKNELDLLPHILYEHSVFSLRELQDATSAWTYDQKAEALQTYTGQLQGTEPAGKALEAARYGLDMLCDYGIYNELIRSIPAVQAAGHQLLTPRYGFDIPRAVEEAELADQYETCFDEAGGLYSKMQAKGLTTEAQYATLLGHRVRCKLILSAADMSALYQQISAPQAYPGQHKLIRQLYDKIAEVHPLLAGSMKAVKKTDVSTTQP